MNALTLERRALLRSGALGAAALALPAMRARAEPVAPLAGPLLGWLIVQPDGAAVFRVFDEGADRREIAGQRFSPASLATLGRQANATLAALAAESWGVRKSDCVVAPSRIVHLASGRSLPVAIWTDFA